MIMNKTELKQILTDLFKEQKLAVLSTHNKEGPYSSLVAFAFTEDLKYILFATTRATRKYANMTDNSSVSLLVDNRSNDDEDFYRAVAVTATGKAVEVEDFEKEGLLNIYLDKLPYLKHFVTSPTCALLKVTVKTYYIVNRFQNVMEFHVNYEDSNSSEENM